MICNEYYKDINQHSLSSMLDEDRHSCHTYTSRHHRKTISNMIASKKWIKLVSSSTMQNNIKHLFLEHLSSVQQFRVFHLKAISRKPPNSWFRKNRFKLDHQHLCQQTKKKRDRNSFMAQKQGYSSTPLPTIIRSSHHPSHIRKYLFSLLSYLNDSVKWYMLNNMDLFLTTIFPT